MKLLRLPPKLVLARIAELLRPFVEVEVTLTDVGQTLQQSPQPQSSSAGPAGQCLKITHAAKRLDCSRPTVYAMIEAGELKTADIRGRPHVTLDSILALQEVKK